jgi:CdiI immunity protein
MISERQHELLRQFFAGFFHQDWRVEADTPEGVVTHYATQMNDHAALPELNEAILAFIDDHPDGDHLADALFRQLGCYYSPKLLGQSTKEWLLHIAERVRAEQQARR